ncbi:uncharacterized protein LOC111865394 isoform X2 [Cryptotermes secundus]|uniref:uncharacterized protein LOC111865394 isoform X2 n=1 Tax=Cryptotermes secundus TaxID=105785 RepID=UPI000CD7CB37|nr:uncharacterized protein LOC111865394 isoform X2 [Cryptotermes secundus]
MGYLCFAVIALVAVSAVKSNTENEDYDRIEMSLETTKNCKDLPNGKIRLNDIVIEQLGRNKMAISGTLDVEVPVTDSFKLKVMLTKCPSKLDRHMCEDFPETMINDFCKKLPKEGQVWSDFVKDLKHFDPHCPIPKGHYKFHRHPIDVEGVANMPLMEGYWIMICEGYIHGERVMCERTEMVYSRKVRRHHA